MAFYLDSSAAAKLVVAEPDSEAMTSWAAAHETQVIASDVLRTELLRATRRSAPDRMQRARSVLDALTLFSLTSATFERAATLDPEGLRSLDAIHLAAALELGDELDGIVTYNERMAAVASLYGVAVISPGMRRRV
jgi:predicted nucleic acid-binding protein